MKSPDPRSCEVAVIGAGITGLTAAFYLARGGLKVAVLEATERVGGAIVTHSEGGWLVELGPNTVLENNRAVSRLILDSGLSAERLEAATVAKKRFLWKGDRLHPLPAGPVDFLTTPLFSVGAKLRLLKEPWVPKPADDHEESIADFVRRRLGPAFLDYAVGPFVSGVYAGDPERLSVRWAVRKIWALEQEHGSLIRGALARRKGPAPGGKMISFRRGLDELPRCLAEDIGSVRTATVCRRVVRRDGDFQVETDGETCMAERVVVALPAESSAELLEEASGGRSRLFAEVPYAPVVVVGLGFRRAAVEHPLDGFGFLAPRKESLRILGCLFTSRLFPGRSPDDHVLLTAFAGGRTDPGIVAWEDAELYGTVLGELTRSLGARGEPGFRILRRWPRAIPQYELGHGRFVQRARELERDLPGLYVAGNFIGGVSVADCIQRGTGVARRILEEVAAQE